MPHHNRDLGRQVRDRIKRTGERYQEALAVIRDGRRFIFADDVERFLAGEGRRGVSHDEVVDKELVLAGIRDRTVYACHTCGDSGDARTEDITIQLVVTRYDPDLSPATELLELRYNHARCAPSALIRVNRRDVSHAPAHTTMCLGDESGVEGRFAITPRPVMVPPGVLDPRSAPEPALMITVEVTDDHGRGATTWLSKLERSLWLPAGFGEHFTEAAVRPGWSVRLVQGDLNGLVPNWVAVRVAEPSAEDEPPGHLFLGALDIPVAWSEALSATGVRDRILVLVGPRAPECEVPLVPVEPEPGLLGGPLKDGAFLGAYLPFIHDRTGSGREETS
ncbi:hypothetical protein AB0D67_37070 [Streptosporangium sp. NPDC048047]|uniref:hypothetical protein n=1 Tax=Streptosporangium sp. NPDC048047 TaxID=3155748 RepID=UPI00342B487B